MENIKFFIDGKEVIANRDETILQVARREGIYIPTMCYLTKVKPIASCRMCVVEVEGIDTPILSCQERAVEGIKVTTQSAELQRHRENIMKLYDVNHPLECGVCDKSGECDLQNMNLQFGVNSQQFTAKDQKREIKDWNFIQYDPSLCILCEKCVHTCNEIIGDDAIEVKTGGYNSQIVTKNSDTLDCTFCGECIAVCPVGALISRDFKYKSNAWELERVPASCAHCSAGCHLYYEVKKESGTNPEKVIKRVNNEFEFMTLCGAGRFGFGFALRGNNRDEKAFKRAVEAFKESETIAFNSLITNEEAMILQKLKEKYDKKLVNREAKNYQNFLNSYSKIVGKSLYSGDLNSIEKSDYIIVFGSDIVTDNPAVRYRITSAVKKNRAEVIYMHPIDEPLLQNTITKHIKYEVGSEEGVLALFLKSLLNSDDKEVKSFLDSIDEGYLSAESNVGEEEIEEAIKKMKRKKEFSIIIGDDIISHKRASNIAKLVGLMEKYLNFKVLIIPSKTNTLGVSLICNLDDEESGKVFGYNSEGDFIVGSGEDADLKTPALNQQEGTFTNIDKRVVPTNVAISFKGYNLNDLANELGLKEKYTIDYTAKLPTEKGFKEIEFDDLDNYYGIDGKENRGYLLKNCEVKIENSLEEVSELDTFNGTVIYLTNPVLQFNNQTGRANLIKSEPLLIGSKQFAIGAKVKSGEVVEIEFDGYTETLKFEIDEELKGVIAKMPTFNLKYEDILASKYRYIRAKISSKES